MTLDQLQVLKIINKTGSFRAAAQELHRAQSAVSHAVRSLEEELGFELFDRSEYRPRLTSAGEAILLRAQRVLDEAEELEALGTQLQQGVEPEISLAVSILTPLTAISPSLRRFMAAHKRTRLNLSTEVLGAIYKLEEHEVDLAIVELLTHRNEDIQIEPLFKTKMIPVASPNHPLCTRKKKTEKDLKEHVQIVIKSRGEQVKDDNPGVIDVKSTWGVTDALSKLELLRNGLGWGNMAEHWIINEIRSGELVRIPTDVFAHQSVPLFLAKRKDKVLGPAGRALWESLLDCRIPKRKKP